ncbi:YBR062C [Zygosaccharomyces parabailii]|uniref:BN860_05688g1_1 n=1 Tax=Zygosaccharomyces bailii (strain CLIB 213 / ATCC 58445 / CBS 680 / BCRC 21525 / NBRC 1098 / NCYC 1416 / NRRL Y-2227) TaxID=1333698 RepID=A0A8J2X613_ZYGB2|nr:YBR062C [Zygosaccharomyces parabailii]CDF88251.1 BN860_05688g1_1 [Zygosaccharomyces bailii CLIB 213]CDH14852.1 uncharacterized protein ZBAI_06638 [Zygosaccharomyces bailii ISA1307]SJM81781.1 uncharacterized protein ZBIST_0114 [Zygosaccharomyces bailii]
MSNYEEEHGISRAVAESDTSHPTSPNGGTGGSEVRSQFQELFQAFSRQEDQEEGDNARLLMLLSQLIPPSLQEEWMEQMEQSNKKGCPQEFIDSLPRISVAKLNSDDSCPICCTVYLEDDYPLVARLPHCGHTFDLECISVWLSKSTSCPLCRDDVTSHKVEVDTSQAELEQDWGMFG